MTFRARGAAVLAALVLAQPASGACPGDCNDDGGVEIAELILGVRIALEDESTDGDGTFAGELRVAIGDSPYALALSDVDRNGTLDLIAATGATDEVAVRLQNESGGPD